MSTDALHRFLFNGLPVRGALVRVSAGWREALARRATVGAFPAPVRMLLGEMAAAGLLLHSSIKFDGALILQIHGDGPLKLAVAEVRSGFGFRATAQVTGAITDAAGFPDLVNVHGTGRCAITLDAADRPSHALPYQGVVPLYDDDRVALPALAPVLEHYMLQSEQLDTRLVLAANDDCAAGLLLQRMPLSGAGNLGGGDDEQHIGKNEDFNRIALLGTSVTRDELLGLDVDTLLRRLFWQEDLQRFAPQDAHFACTCGRPRVARMLMGLGRAELDDIIAERVDIEVGCEFCGLQYHFDAVDVAGLFTAPHDRGDTVETLQ